ncbi:MAG: hypothetical protein ACI9DJ_002431 [Algoriphagus sp.]|jgi:hypothetical protein
MFSTRTARELEDPSNNPVNLSDVNGNKTSVPVLGNSGVNGRYMSSDGIEGTDIWGTRAKWMALSGTINKKNLTFVPATKYRVSYLLARPWVRPICRQSARTRNLYRW